MRARDSVHDRWLSLALALWLLACVAGVFVLWRYGARPSDAGDPAPIGLRSADLSLDPRLPTLVMFAHPRCPCTRASIEEVARLRAKRPGAFAVRMVFCAPETGSANDDAWRHTASRRRASALPGAVVIDDPGGKLAYAAGARTSGLVALYAPDGETRFWGGVTASRGMEGPSAGSRAVLAILDGETPETTSTPVYGCALVAPRAPGAPGAPVVHAGATE